MIDLSSYPKIQTDLDSQVNNVEYLVNIAGSIYIASRKQMFDIYGADGDVDITGGISQYWEDLDLKISAINEKIDITNKKIYLSNTSITLSNYPVDDKRISDILGVGFGKLINIYIKTQSCRTLSDCLPIANLKITRITHDEKKVKIEAEDSDQQGFYSDIPRPENILKKNVNTFESYDLKSVPILYGHLESAPAVVYIENLNASDYSYYDENGILLLPDNSYISDNPDINIAGIKDFGEEAFSSTDDVSYLENNDIVQMKIGDALCSVNCTQYYNARDQYPKTNSTTGSLAHWHTYRQYEPYNDHIRFNSKYNSVPTLIRKNGLWVHTNSKSLSKNGIILRMIRNWDLFYGEDSLVTQAFPVTVEGDTTYFGSLEDDLGGVFTTQGDVNFSDGGVSVSGFHSIGVEKIEFEPLPSTNRLIRSGSDKAYPGDMNIIGKLKLKVLTNDISFYENATGMGFSVMGFPSGYQLDETNFGDFESFVTESGYPSEFGDDFEEFDSVITMLLLTNNPNDEGISLGLSCPETAHFQYRLLETASVFHTQLEMFGSNEYSTEQSATSYMSYLIPHQGIYGAVINQEIRSNFPSLFKNEDWTFGDEEVGLMNWENSLGGINVDMFEEQGYVADWDFPMLSATEMCFYYMHNPYITATGTQTTLESTWEKISMRRFWCEAEIFTKDFFVNARGRTGNHKYQIGIDESTQKIERVGGRIKILVDNATPEDSSFLHNEDDQYANGNENIHFEDFWELLNNKKYKRKFIGDYSYEIMIMTQVDAEMGFLYDIELKDLFPSDSISPETHLDDNSHNVHETDYDTGDFAGVNSINHSVGWEIAFSANNFGYGGQEVTQLADDDSVEFVWNHFNGVRLVYGRKVYRYEDNKLILDSIEVASQEDSMELYNFNWKNGCPEGTSSENERLGYTILRWEDSNATGYNHMIDNPAEIIKNLVETEISPATTFDIDKYQKAYLSDTELYQAFSINEKVNSKEIIENICNQSRLFFRYRPRDGSGIIEAIKDFYNANDVDMVVDVDRMLKFSFNKTKLEDLCFGGCRVKYGYDYAKEEMTEITLDRTLDPGALEIYKNLYSVNADDIENYQLEFEAPYIQDEASASRLRNYLFELNKHQHLTCKFTLDIRDGISIETGDIINFSGDPYNTKPYGKSLISSYNLVEQIVTPNFLVTKVSKSSTNVMVEVYQLHRLNTRMLTPTLLGDANLDGVVNSDDVALLLNYVLDPGTYPLTEQQFLNGDVNGDGSIDQFDINEIMNFPYYEGGAVGGGDDDGDDDGDEIPVAVVTNPQGMMMVGDSLSSYGEPGELVTLSASESYDNDGEVVGYSWLIEGYANWGEDEEWDTEEMSFYLPVGGEFLDITEVHLVVTDDDGNDSEEIIHSVYILEDPIAVIDCQEEANATDDVYASGLNSYSPNPYGEILGYQWTWEFQTVDGDWSVTPLYIVDGNPELGEFTFFIGEPGTLTLRLSVFDSLFHHSEEVTHTVIIHPHIDSAELVRPKPSGETR